MELDDIYAEVLEAVRAAGIQSQSTGRMWERCAAAANGVWARYYAEKEAELDDKSEVAHTMIEVWKASAEHLHLENARLTDALKKEGLTVKEIQEIRRG